MIQVGYGDQRFPEPDVTRVKEMSSTSCSRSHSQAGFGPEDDLWYLAVLFKEKSLACTCLQEAKQTNLRLFTGLYSTEHTKSSAVTGPPFWSLATTIFPSLSFISWRLVVSARMAIISLATAISNWACKVEMRIMNQIKVSWNTHRGSSGINSGKINFTLEFKTSPKW